MGWDLRINPTVSGWFATDSLDNVGSTNSLVSQLPWYTLSVASVRGFAVTDSLGRNVIHTPLAYPGQP